MRRIACLLLVAFALGCSSAPAPEPEAAPEAAAPAAETHRYELRGKVLELRPGEANAAVIEHEEIVGFMDAMTMTFPVKAAEDFAKLHANDYIHADVVSSDDAFYIENIEVVEAPAPAAAQ
jgi:Cu/Ag efflux protein CusF